MTYHALLEYIRAAKGAGARDGEITQQLTEAGWYTVDVQDALHLYGKLASQKPATAILASTPALKPTLAKRFAPRQYDPHLVAVASIAFAVGFVGFLLIAAL